MWVSSRASFHGRVARGDFGRALDSLANPEIRRAATQVAPHRAVDLRIARLRVAFEQRSRRHELAALTIPALRNVELAPGLLQRMFSRGVEALDRGHGLSAHRRDLRLARACRCAVEVDGAGAALTDAAPVLRPDESQRVAKHP